MDKYLLPKDSKNCSEKIEDNLILNKRKYEDSVESDTLRTTKTLKRGNTSLSSNYSENHQNRTTTSTKQSSRTLNKLFHESNNTPDLNERTVQEITDISKTKGTQGQVSSGTTNISQLADANVNSFLDINEEKLLQNSEIQSFLLKKLIRDEKHKQTELEKQSLKQGKVVEKLLRENESEILEKFFSLSDGACRVFARMLGRKRSWHRVSAINYKDIGNNLENEFQELNKENYVDINIEDEVLKVQLELLSKPEVTSLCKQFCIPLKNYNSIKKEALIKALIANTKLQKSVFELSKGKNLCTRVDKLKFAVNKCLGMCIKLNDNTWQAFNKILLLSSFAHYYGEEDKRFSNELFLSFQVYKNIIKFPNYTVFPTVIFETQADFEKYKISLILYDSCETAMSNKDFEAFLLVCRKAKEEFQSLLKNLEYQNRFKNLKPFLRKFSASTVYARILTKYCSTFKRKSNQKDVINILELLLGQNLFLQRKRAEWYEILSKTLEKENRIEEAAKVVIKALNEPLLSEAQKLSLQFRGHVLLKRKKNGINNTEIKKMLEELCTVTMQELPSLEIAGKSVEGNESGHKIVYVRQFENEKVYTSVEGMALSYYKSQNFTKGYHSEGSIIQSIYFLLFFDIIYEVQCEGAFQSSFQEAPLDFYSSSFYDNRKEEIDLLLCDMLEWNDEEVEGKLRDVYNRNYGTACLINWGQTLTPELLCDLIQCITMPTLICLLKRFVRNFREVQAGFPDLTLWNPKTKKCKFVEVKSPNDKLSPGQRVWLDFLRSIGLDCEVCNVRNV